MKKLLTILILLTCSNSHAQLSFDGSKYTAKLKDENVYVERIGMEPQVRLTKWGEESYLSIRYPHSIAQSPIYSDNKVLVSGLDNGIEYYKFDENTFKMSLVLNKKPLVNSWSFELYNWKEFNFWYQRPFNNVNQDGSTWENGTQIDYGIITRSAKVSGSYAVYHKIKQGNKYGTGKFIHIYRPRFYDINGKEEWGTINIENGIYTISVSQKFLDEAKYPVKTNDEFGFSGIGGTCGYITPDTLTGHGIYSPGSDGTMTSVSMYVNIDDNRDMTFGLYDNDAGGPNNLLRDTGGGQHDSGWYTQTLDSNYTVSSGTSYWIGANWNSGSAHICYDATGGDPKVYYKTDAYVSGSLTDPFPASPSSLNRKYSLYGTYTPTTSSAMTFIISKKN